MSAPEIERAPYEGWSILQKMRKPGQQVVRAANVNLAVKEVDYCIDAHRCHRRFSYRLVA